MEKSYLHKKSDRPTDPHFMHKLISLSPTLQLYTHGNKLPTKDELGIAMSKGELAIPSLT